MNKILIIVILIIALIAVYYYLFIYNKTNKENLDSQLNSDVPKVPVVKNLSSSDLLSQLVVNPNNSVSFVNTPRPYIVTFNEEKLNELKTLLSCLGYELFYSDSETGIVKYTAKDKNLEIFSNKYPPLSSSLTLNIVGENQKIYKINPVMFGEYKNDWNLYKDISFNYYDNKSIDNMIETLKSFWSKTTYVNGYKNVCI